MSIFGVVGMEWSCRAYRGDAAAIVSIREYMRLSGAGGLRVSQGRRRVGRHGRGMTDTHSLHVKTRNKREPLQQPRTAKKPLGPSARIFHLSRTNILRSSSPLSSPPFTLAPLEDGTIAAFAFFNIGYNLQSLLRQMRRGNHGGQIAAAPYNYPHDASLGPETTALVIIDMQRDCRAIAPR